jgi:leucyl aminopeptidase
MDEMKFDMGGAASVLGTLRAVAELKPKLNVIGLIPPARTCPAAARVKPGDVVTSMSGQTIEILNTDAEGRLILCDALTYAERFKPAAVVDIATLTGACVIALGHHRIGPVQPDDALAADLLAAGQAALDPAWRMPLDEEYDEAPEEQLRRHGQHRRPPGRRHHRGHVPQALCTASALGAPRHRRHGLEVGAAKGATGRPVPLLTHFVLSHASPRAASVGAPTWPQAARR